MRHSSTWIDSCCKPNENKCSKALRQKGAGRASEGLPVNELTQREIDEIINGVEDEELEFEMEDFESSFEEEKEDAKTKDVGGKKMAGEDRKNVTKTQQGTGGVSPGDRKDKM